MTQEHAVMEVGGLEEPVPNLTVAESVPTVSDALTSLYSIIPELPTAPAQLGDALADIMFGDIEIG